MSGLSPELRYRIGGPRRPIEAIRNAPADSSLRLLFVHGYGEHKEMLPYRLLAAALAEVRIEVHGFDLPGHAVERELPSRWDPMREDMAAVVSSVRPDAILGHSLGSIVALDWAIASASRIPLITSGAPLGRVSVPGLVLWIGRLLSVFAPRANFSPRLRVDSVSRDKELLREYMADPLFHQRATGPAIGAFFDAVSSVKRRAGELRAPLLMLHGDADAIARPEEEFIGRTASTERSRKLYRGARHHLFLETNREEVYGDIVAFLRGISGRDAA